MRKYIIQICNCDDCINLRKCNQIKEQCTRNEYLYSNDGFATGICTNVYKIIDATVLSKTKAKKVAKTYLFSRILEID